MQRDQLADEERGEAFRRLPARPEDPLLRADEADGDRSRACRRARRGSRAFCSVSATTRSARRSASRSSARRHRAGGASRREAPAVLDEGLGERHERVEDHRPAARDAPGGGEVEVAGIADDRARRSARVGSPEEPRLGDGEPRGRPEPERPLVPPPLPDADVALDHVHAGAAQARDHLGVARVVALVRPEVEDASELSAGSRPRAARSSGRAGALLVVAGDHLARPGRARRAARRRRRAAPRASAAAGGRSPRPSSLSTVR